MLKLFLNTVQRKWYDSEGSALPDGHPQIPYCNTEKVLIQCCTNTPNDGTGGLDPDNEWTKDSSFGITGVTALLSADDNFVRNLKGSLKNELSAGDVSSLVVTITGATDGKVPDSGTVRVLDSSGNSESLEYTGRSIDGSDVTFTLASGSTAANTYPAETEVACPEALYMQAAMSVAESDPATGLFVFNITAYSKKLREKVDYADLKEVDVKGLELLIFTIDGDGIISTRGTFICDTFTIPLPMADPNPNPNLPDTARDGIATIVEALFALGFEVQFSIDGIDSWHDDQVDADKFYRFRAVAAGQAGEWSEAIALIIPTDAFVYVAYASDDSGTDFNLTPSDTLKYRAEIHVTEEIAAPAASDFSGATWVKYIGDSITGDAGQDAFVYVAYATDASGTGFSLVPYDTHAFRAEIHVISEIETPTILDFAGATWVRYLGYDGDSAYEVWLNEGNSGTEADYLASLKGDTGDNGTGVAPQGTYDSGTTYALNEGVTYDGSYYSSLAADNIGNQPDISPTYWEEMISKGATGPEVKHIIKDSATVTNGSVVLDAYKDIYTASVSADTTFTFDISGLGDLTNKVVTFELHIDMTAISFLGFPEDIYSSIVYWVGGDTPIFNNINKYILVFRTDGSLTPEGGLIWLGNLAYRE